MGSFSVLYHSIAVVAQQKKEEEKESLGDLWGGVGGLQVFYGRTCRAC